MKKAALTSLFLLILAGMSLGETRNEVVLKKDNFRSEKAPSTVTLCQRMACISEKLEMTAKVYYWEKNYQKAVEFYKLLLKAGKSEFDDLYNLACCYGQLGNEKQAAKYLKLAVEDGFTDIDHIKTDPDFEKVKDSPKFIKALSDISNKLVQGDNLPVEQAAQKIQPESEGYAGS